MKKNLILFSFIVLLSCTGDDWRDPLGISFAGDGSELKADGSPFIPQPGHLALSYNELIDVPFKQGSEDLKIYIVLKNTGTEDLTVKSVLYSGNVEQVEGIADGIIIQGSDSLEISIDFSDDAATGKVDFTWNSLDNPDSTESFDISVDIGNESAWDLVYDEIMDKKCSCHLTASGAGDLIMNSKAVAYAQLVDYVAEEVPSLKRVEPWQPNASYLVKKIVGVDIEGDRMPRDGPPYLTEKRIAQIITWIRVGATE